MVTLEKIINKGVSVIITVGALALVYGGVFYIGKLVSTPSEPVEVPIVDVPDVTDLSECQKQTLSGDLAKFFPTITSCEQDKYSRFTPVQILSNEHSPDEISTLSIIDSSKRIKVEGEFDSVMLYVNATVDDAEYAPTRKNAVFFIIDGGKYQGYLRASRDSQSELSVNSSGVFLSKDIPKVIIEDLTKPISVSARKDATGMVDVNFSDKLNMQGTHLIYAYVSKPKYGKIVDLSLAYACKPQSRCSITVGQ